MNHLRTGLTRKHTAPSACITYTGAEAQTVAAQQEAINVLRTVQEQTRGTPFLALVAARDPRVGLLMRDGGLIAYMVTDAGQYVEAALGDEVSHA